MRPTNLVTIVWLLLTPMVASAADPGGQTVIDTSTFVADGRELRSFTKEVVVRATPTKAFDAWTTAEGLKGFLEVDSKVELRVGGPYELYFIPESEGGPTGSNGCQVLAYVPDQMLAFSWNAPPQFPDERARHTWVVLTFTDQGEAETRVTLTHVGFGQGGRWDEVYAYFDAAWDRVLEALVAHFS